MLHDQTRDTRESLISTSGTGRQVRGDVTGIGGNCKCASVEQSPPPPPGDSNGASGPSSERIRVAGPSGEEVAMSDCRLVLVNSENQ